MFKDSPRAGTTGAFPDETGMKYSTAGGALEMMGWSEFRVKRQSRQSPWTVLTARRVCVVRAAWASVLLAAAGSLELLSASASPASASAPS